MRYIDAEKLIAEIERYENTANDAYNPRGEDADFWYGKVVACEDFKTLVTSLQQEQSEVDFGMEVYKYIGEHFKVYDDGNQTLQNKDKNTLIGRVDAENIAKHFFELGLKAKQS